MLHIRQIFTHNRMLCLSSFYLCSSSTFSAALSLSLHFTCRHFCTWKWTYGHRNWCSIIWWSIFRCFTFKLSGFKRHFFTFDMIILWLHTEMSIIFFLLTFVSCANYEIFGLVLISTKAAPFQHQHKTYSTLIYKLDKRGT